MQNKPGMIRKKRFIEKRRRFGSDIQLRVIRKPLITKKVFTPIVWISFASRPTEALPVSG